MPGRNIATIGEFLKEELAQHVQICRSLRFCRKSRLTALPLRAVHCRVTFLFNAQMASHFKQSFYVYASEVKLKHPK